jgi:cyclic pyranopterin monophosphate synthase
MDVSQKLSHVDEDGRIRMVDVSNKSESFRVAIASGEIHMPLAVVQQLAEQSHRTAKGSIIDTAIIAGIQGAKRTSSLIPLCHPLALSGIDITILPTPKGFTIRCEVRTTGTTGVEMEALTGVSTAALTMYDMCKALSHDMEIGAIRLESKTGGKSDFNR